MIREIVRPTSTEYIIHIPDEYIDKEVEILVLPIDTEKVVDKKVNKELFSATAGILRPKGIDPVKWQQKIRNEWEKRLQQNFRRISYDFIRSG